MSAVFSTANVDRLVARHEEGIEVLDRTFDAKLGLEHLLGVNFGLHRRIRIAKVSLVGTHDVSLRCHVD